MDMCPEGNNPVKHMHSDTKCQKVPINEKKENSANT